MHPVNPSPEYHEEVQMHFMTAAGNPKIVLGSKEWVQIDAWFESGFALAAVLRGIDLAFEEHRKKRSPRPITSLMYCKPWVEDLAAKFPKVRNQEEPCPKSSLSMSHLGMTGASTVLTPDISSANAGATSASVKTTDCIHVPTVNEQPRTGDGSQTSSVPADQREDQVHVRPGLVGQELPRAPRRDLPRVQPAPKREMATAEDITKFWKEMREISERKGLR